MSWKWRMIQKLKRNWLVVLKLTWGILTRALENLKNLCFNWLLVTKVYHVWATNIQKSYVSWHWRKTYLWFEKLIEKFRRFSPEHLKVSKLGLCCDLFVQSREGMTLKFTEELCVMTMKNNAEEDEFEEELTCHFKIDMKNLTNFDLSTQKFKKNCSYIGCFDQSI